MELIWRLVVRVCLCVWFLIPTPFRSLLSYSAIGSHQHFFIGMSTHTDKQGSFVCWPCNFPKGLDVGIVG